MSLECVQSVFNIEVISSYSESSVSIFGIFVLLELFVFDDFMCYDVHLMTMIICIFSSN